MLKGQRLGDIASPRRCTFWWALILLRHLPQALSCLASSFLPVLLSVESQLHRAKSQPFRLFCLWCCEGMGRGTPLEVLTCTRPPLEGLLGIGWRESCLHHLSVHQNSGGQASPSLTLATTQERPSSHESLSTSSLPLALAHKLSLALSHTGYGFFSAIMHSGVKIRGCSWLVGLERVTLNPSEDTS